MVYVGSLGDIWIPVLWIELSRFSTVLAGHEGQKEGPEDVPELEKLEKVEVPILMGVNSRNLKFQTDLSWFITICVFCFENVYLV